MPEFNDQSVIINGVWIQEKYSGDVGTTKGSVNAGGSMTLKRNYQLRYKGIHGADPTKNPTLPMHQTQAYAAFQSFILRWQYVIDYQTNEGIVQMLASKISVNADKNNYPVYNAECTWEFDPRKPSYIFEQVIWSHRMVAGTRTLSIPMGQQKYYTRLGVPPIQHHGVNWDKDKKNYEGVECYAPEWRMTAKQQLLASFVTPQYLLAINAMRPCVNLTPFRGYPHGTVLYLGADIDEAPIVLGENHLVDITHQFVVEPNMPPFIYDGIQVGGKGGHEYMWTTCYTGQGSIPVTDQVNIAQMYAPAELNFLGLS